MKHSALFLVAALDAALYLCPSPKAPEAPARTAAVAAPRRAAKTYFHSSLNAPAMSVSEHTGLGYFSADPSSEFRGD